MPSRLFLSVIIAVGLILRVFNVTSNPPALYGDELTIALDANSILKTGKDQLGNPFPLTFKMGAGRGAGYVYGSIPFVTIFGTTALGVRSLSILSGIGIIILLYFLGKMLFSKKAGLAASLVAAFSPWDISLSRGGFEAHFALFLLLLGTYFFLKAKQKPLLYLISAMSFGLTLHTYPTYKMTLPIFLVVLFWFIGTKNILKEKKLFLGGLITLVILGILSLSQTFIGDSEERFKDINIFARNDLKASIEQKVNFERSISNLPPILSKYFYNKPVEYTKQVLENYLQNFSLDFLIIHGDGHPRHNMATMGVIYFADMILILTGLMYLGQTQKRLILFLITWLLLAPIPTAFIDTPHGLRSSLMLPPLILLSSLGIVAVLSLKNKLFLSVIFLLFLIQLTTFKQKLFFLAPFEYSKFWAYPAKLASEIAIENTDKFEYIFLSDKIDNIEFAYPVYANVDPEQVIKQNKQKVRAGTYEFKKFNNVFIGNIPDSQIEEFVTKLIGKVLFIGDIGQRQLLESYETIDGLDKRRVLILKKKI